jgi:hypothetical protein
MYVLAGNPKIVEIGRIMFWTGLLAFLMGGGAIRNQEKDNMSCGTGLIECDTIQIIEPNDDLLVDTAVPPMMSMSGEVDLFDGQNNAVVTFQVPKLNANAALNTCRGRHWEH